MIAKPARPERGGHLAHEGVVRVLGRGARRAEHGDGAGHARERGEPPGELRGDLAHTVGVGRAHLRRLVAEPQQQLLVEGRRDAVVVGAPRHAACAQRTPIRSTTNTSVSSGPITPPAPRLP